MEEQIILNRNLIPDFLSLTITPNEDLREKWNTLLGIDTLKQRLLTQIKLSLEPDELFSWYRCKYKRTDVVLPLFAKHALLLGPSGSGKTTMAQGLADAYGRYSGKKVYLVKLGAVRSKLQGGTSANIIKAFQKVKELSRELAVILLLDELDSLANQRNFEQMHEDIREAVNTLIKELDSLASYRVFVIGCSNLEGNIDEAVKRRFAEGLVLRFGRPNKYERYH
jgi:SpoVK/Ycf46/Vps4 family AAA+-type ATPase